METLLKTLAGFGLDEHWALLVLFVLLLFGVAAFIPGLSGLVLSAFVFMAPVWLPVVLGVLFWYMWIAYVRANFIANQDITILEVKVPRDVEKSPKAMEAVFSGLHVGIGETTFINRWWEGKVRPWFSLELASIEGRIHFYIWTRSFLKDVVEAQIYAQYPEVEVHEVDDYTHRIQYDPNKHSLWGSDFVLGGKDAFPIMTYVDYELDKDPKEEYKIDPSAQIFEHLSTLGKGEQLWLQILIRVNKDEVRTGGLFGKKEKRWQVEAREQVEEIKKKGQVEVESILDPSKTVKSTPMLSMAQRMQVDAIERSIGKQGFDTGMRFVYIAEKDAFKPIRFVGMLNSFKQFGSEHLNSIKPTRWNAKFDYPWQEWFGAVERTRRGVFDAFRRRSWFHEPYKTTHFIMTPEELATIYHFPPRAVKAPGLERIPSAKAEAPPNLPV